MNESLEAILAEDVDRHVFRRICEVVDAETDEAEAARMVSVLETRMASWDPYMRCIDDLSFDGALPTSFQLARTLNFERRDWTRIPEALLACVNGTHITHLELRDCPELATL